MKKFIVTLLVLALLAGIAYGVYFYIMMPPINDFNQAKANLEKAGYTVAVREKDNDDYLSDGVIKALRAEDENEKDNFLDGIVIDITVYESAELAKIRYKELKTYIDYYIGQLEIGIDEFEYELEYNRDELSDSQIKKYEEYIESGEKNLEFFEDLYVAYFDNTVWYGTKDAIKASKG